MPFFSVLIPACNAERFIVQTLDSVYKQTCTDYDIVVVDDGSTDATRSLVEDWARRHVAVRLRLYCQPNRGAGAARNVGLRAATGGYVALLDADDLWRAAKLEHIRRLLQAEPAPDVVCHDVWHMVHGTVREVRRCGPFTRYADLLWGGNCLTTSATVVRRRAVLEVGGFTEDRRLWEDYDLWLRLSRHGSRFAYLHEVLGIRRTHGQNLTSQVDAACQRSLQVLEAHFAVWQPRTPLYRYRMRRRRGAVYRRAGLQLLRARTAPAARRLLWPALRQDPLAWRTWAALALSLARLPY